MTSFDLNLFPMKSSHDSANSRMNLHSSPETITTISEKCLLEKSYYNLGHGEVSTSNGQNDSEVSLDLQLTPPLKPQPKFNWFDTKQESDAENIYLGLGLGVDLIKPEQYDERFRDNKEAEFDFRNSFGRHAKHLNKNFVIDLNCECVESDDDANMPTNSSKPPLESVKIFGKVILNSKGPDEIEPAEMSEPKNNSGHLVFDDFDMPTNSSKPLESFKIFGKVILCSKGHFELEPTELSEPKNNSGHLVFDDFDGNDHGTSKVDSNIVECNQEIEEFKELQKEGTLSDVTNSSQHTIKKIEAIQEELSCDSEPIGSHNAVEKLDFVQEELCCDDESNSSHAAAENLEASQEESSYDSESNSSYNAIERSEATQEELSSDNESNSSYNNFEKLEAIRELSCDAESCSDVNRELEHDNPHHENADDKDEELVKECLVKQSQASSLNGNYSAGWEKYIQKPEESNGKPQLNSTWKGKRAWGTVFGVDKDIVEENEGGNTKKERGTESGRHKDNDKDVETCKMPAWKRRRTWGSTSVINKDITEENEGSRKHVGKGITETAKNATWNGKHARGTTSGLDRDIVEEIEERNTKLERVSKLGLDKGAAGKTEKATWKGKRPWGKISGFDKSFIEENEDENTRNEWGTKSGINKDFEVGDHEVRWIKHGSVETNINNRSSYKQAKPNHKRDGYSDKSYKHDEQHNDCRRDDRRKRQSHRSANHTNHVNQFRRKRADYTWVRKDDGLRCSQKFPRNENACEETIPLPASRMQVHDTRKGLIQNSPNYQRSVSPNIIQNSGNLSFSFGPSPRSLECPPEKWLGYQKEPENGYYLRNSVDPRYASTNGYAREIINSSRVQYSIFPVASFQRNVNPQPLQYYSHVGEQTHVLLNERYHGVRNGGSRPSPYGEHCENENDQRRDQHSRDLLRIYYERGIIREYEGNDRTQFGESSNGAGGTREQEGKYGRRGWHDAMMNNKRRKY